MGNSFLDWMVVAMPALVSIAGAILTVKLPDEKYRIYWIVGFLVLGLILSLLVYLQQSRTAAAYAKQQEDLQNALKRAQFALDQSLLSQEYMKGQLNSLSLVIGKTGASSSKTDLKELANSIEKMVTSQISSATNKQICANTLALVQRMRKFEYETELEDRKAHDKEWNAMVSLPKGPEFESERRRLWQEQTANSMQRSMGRQYEFRSNFLGEAVYLRDELLRRLPDEPAPKGYETVMFKGMLAGPNPISAGATYLEGLARKLCP